MVRGCVFGTDNMANGDIVQLVYLRLLLLNSNKLVDMQHSKSSCVIFLWEDF